MGDQPTPESRTANGISEDSVAMSEQQRRFSASRNPLLTYRDLSVGCDGSWLQLFGYELYSTFLSGLPGVAGFGLRQLFLPYLLANCGPGLAVGRGVSIRQPRRISLGRGVMIDEGALLDYRSSVNNPAGGIFIEDHVLLGRNSLVVSKGGTIRLRRACNISSFCRIATQSQIDIGESVLIAAYAYIGPGNHAADDPDRPLIEQQMDIKGGVTIGANSWIGAHAIVLDGVKIGRDVIVGANSLVKDDVPDRAIVAGTPAKILKYR